MAVFKEEIGAQEYYDHHVRALMIRVQNSLNSVFAA